MAIINIGFRLERCECGDAHVKCPNGHRFDVEWTSEYGDPDVGEHEATCPVCDAKWTFGVYHRYT